MPKIIKSLSTISQVSKLLINKYKKVDFISAYTWNKHFTVFENKFEGDINLNAIESFCVNSLFHRHEDFEDNDEIIFDYDGRGLMAFYQINANCWLIVVASKQLFPLINQEVKKINKKSLTFDLEEIENPILTHIEEEIVKETGKNTVNKSLAAKKLQQSVLPDLSILGTYFNKHFSYHNPKGVLSTDFYWLKETPGSLCLAVVQTDCLSHNLEGELITSIVNNIINKKIVNDPRISLKLIYTELIKSENSENEGCSYGVKMAISRFDKKSGTIDIATSGVSVLYIESEEDYNLLNIKGKQYPNTSNIKIENIKLYTNYGDKLIFYSDGFSDQLDKYGVKKLNNTGVRKMFTSMNGHFSGQAFENNFSEWKGDTKQMDDITVLAIEI